MEDFLNQWAVAAAVVAGGPGRAHLMGLGGVGVAGVARLLAARGWQVDGCERVLNEQTARLQAAGMAVLEGHDPTHIAALVAARASGHAVCLIRSTAVPVSDPEVAAAQAVGITVLQRGVFLAAWVSAHAHGIAVCGAHGKTTTSVFIASLLKRSGRSVEWCIGGESTALGDVAGRYEAAGDACLVAEADESDGTLAMYRPQITVVTNIDVDHLEHFSGLDDLVACYRQVVDATRLGVAWCADNPLVAEVCAGTRGLSFGFHPSARLRAVDVSCGSGTCSFTVCDAEQSVGRVTLGVPGRHNVLNALGALAAGVLAGIPLETAVANLGPACSELPRRRFETVAQARGCRVIIDYAHHPAEIKALLAMAREGLSGPLVVVFQPHRYTRTLALRDAFAVAFDGADHVVLLPVYAASETPLTGGTTEDLYAAFRCQRPTLRVALAQSLPEAWHAAAALLAPGGVLLAVGAGDVAKLAEHARSAAAVTPSLLPGAQALVPLGRLTAFGVGGAADWLAKVATEASLAAVLAEAAQRELPVYVLGAGCNTVVADGGVEGVVVRLNGPDFHRFDRIGPCAVEVGCGLSGSALLDRLEAEGLAGLEFLEGVPGTVGGWLAMNAGAHGGAIKDRVLAIRCLNFDGTRAILDIASCGFAYRQCAGLRGRVALSVSLALQDAAPAEIARQRAAFHVRRIVLCGLRTAGSVFRNPEGKFAGQLLEAAGCKGMRVGGAAVFDGHANVIVAEDGATASDVLALMCLMQRAVEERWGIRLLPEIRILS